MPPYAVFPLVFVLLLCGCAAPQPVRLPAVETEPASSSPAQCRQFLHDVDETVHRHRKQDAQEHALPGLPHLRANRFFSTYDPRTLTPEQARYWLSQLRQLDLHARAAELRNLDSAQWEPVFAQYQRCSAQVLRE